MDSHANRRLLGSPSLVFQEFHIQVRNSSYPDIHKIASLISEFGRVTATTYSEQISMTITDLQSEQPFYIK